MENGEDGVLLHSDVEVWTRQCKEIYEDGRGIVEAPLRIMRTIQRISDAVHFSLNVRNVLLMRALRNVRGQTRWHTTVRGEQESTFAQGPWLIHGSSC